MSEYTITASGCWEWAKSRQKNGYGQAYRQGNRKPQRAHRVYYEENVGPIPSGMHVDHLCRNRACVNPDHLELVSPAENIHRGCRTRLTEDDVRAIRSAPRARGVCIVLAQQYGVSHRYIQDLRRGQKWAGVV